MTPELSIVVPLYRKEAIVLHGLHSVMTQTHTELFVVINDGSIARHADLVDIVRDPHVSFIRQRKQQVAPIRHYGTRCTQAVCVGFPDDDEWLLDHLENTWALKEKQAEAGVFLTARWIAFREDLNLSMRHGRVRHPFDLRSFGMMIMLLSVLLKAFQTINNFAGEPQTLHAHALQRAFAPFQSSLMVTSSRLNITRRFLFATSTRRIYCL